jgi:hypothetical protein
MFNNGASRRDCDRGLGVAEDRTARPGRRVPVAWALFGAFVLVATFASWHQREPDEILPVSRSDGEALLGSAVQLARAGDFAELCQSVALNPGTCEFLLDTARDAGWAPGPDGPEVVRVTDTHVEQLVFHLRGVRADGSSYTSDFPVARDESGNLRSLTPAYWSGCSFPNPRHAPHRPGISSAVRGQSARPCNPARVPRASRNP